MQKRALIFVLVLTLLVGAGLYWVVSAQAQSTTGTHSVSGAGTSIVESGTGTPSFHPVQTTFAFHWSNGQGHFECLALTPSAAPGSAGSGNFDTNVMYVTGPITSVSVEGTTAVFKGTATVTGLGAGSNVPCSSRGPARLAPSSAGTSSATTGFASAIANDGSTITLTGEGTFNAASNFGNRDVTGGGTWQTFDKSGTPTASGTYQVTGFVSFTVAPGTAPLPHDNIGALEDERAGLLFVTIQYSDGSTGVLTVSCHLVGTPNSVFEGIRVSKGFVDYWNGKAPVPGVNGNRTNFHILDHN